jgi:hypothetical protein
VHGDYGGGGGGGGDCHALSCGWVWNINHPQVLGIAANQITVICKRMGGGFGGKETRACVYSAVCAFAAFKLQRPVRFVLERDLDMVLSGLRHPFLGKYKCGVNDQGQILALEMNLYSNGGDSKDLSVAVMERFVLYSLHSIDLVCIIIIIIIIIIITITSITITKHITAIIRITITSIIIIKHITAIIVIE